MVVDSSAVLAILLGEPEAESFADCIASAAQPRIGMVSVLETTAVALRRMVEENLYWTMVYDRWMVEENWRSFRDIVLGGIPAAVRPVIAPIVAHGAWAQNGATPVAEELTSNRPGYQYIAVQRVLVTVAR